MGGLSGVVDEDVGVSGHPSDGSDHVAMYIVNPTPSQPLFYVHSLVQNVQLLCARVLLQQFARDFPLRCEDDAIGG